MNTTRLARLEAKARAAENATVTVYADDMMQHGQNTTFYSACMQMLTGKAVSVVRLLTERQENERMNYIGRCIRKRMIADLQGDDSEMVYPLPDMQIKPIAGGWCFSEADTERMKGIAVRVFPLNAGYSAGGIMSMAEGLKQLASGDAFSVKVVAGDRYDKILDEVTERVQNVD